MTNKRGESSRKRKPQEPAKGSGAGQLPSKQAQFYQAQSMAKDGNDQDSFVSEILDSDKEGGAASQKVGDETGRSKPSFEIKQRPIKLDGFDETKFDKDIFYDPSGRRDLQSREDADAQAMEVGKKKKLKSKKSARAEKKNKKSVAAAGAEQLNDQSVLSIQKSDVNLKKKTSLAAVAFLRQQKTLKKLKDAEEGNDDLSKSSSSSLHDF